MKFTSAFDDIFDDPIGVMRTEDWVNAIGVLILFIFMIVHSTTIFRPESSSALPTSALPTDTTTEVAEEEAIPEPAPEPLLPEADRPYYQFKNFGTKDYFINQRCYYPPEYYPMRKRLYF